MSSLKPIFISLSPNTERDDVLLAWKLKFQPWLWKKGKTVEKLEEEFKRYLGVKYAISFNSGRSALMAILDVLDIKKEDEILLQGFTCNAAVNPILNQGAKPVFVDITPILSLNPEDLKKKITPKSKAVMIQHTFGWPAQIEEILKIAKENNLYLIEDCAHALGAEYQGKFCGTFGEAAFFSFGRDKIISSVFGGMVVTDDEKIGERIREFRGKLDYPSNFWIFQQLLHPVLINCLILPVCRLNQYLGMVLLGLCHKLSILSKAVYKKEKRGEMPEYFPKRFPNALAALALNQFRKLERLNKHRQEMARFYEKELENAGFNLPFARSREGRTPTFMRYPVLANKEFDERSSSLALRSARATDEILKLARKNKIFLDDSWRKSPVIPPDTNVDKMKYLPGSCPEAEKVAQSIVNLPTHINISRKEAQKIVNFLKKYGC
jgi:perosamine synthetase